MTGGSGEGMLLVAPPLGFSGALGISLGGVSVPGMTGGAPAGSGVAHPLTVVEPHGSQHGPFFLDPHRAFNVSHRFGRLEMQVGGA
jgi:hypothetical protein